MQLSARKDTPGDRLRQWGLAKYGSVNAFADAVGMDQSQLSRYLNDHVLPGNKLQAKFLEIGMTIEERHWIMTGEVANQRGKIPASEEDDMLMLARLKSMGIDSLAKLDRFLDPSDIFKDMVRLVRKRQERFRVDSHKKSK
jgi:transcriptional regulator with XRE-family HTH domain